MAKNKAREQAKELPDTTMAICFDLQKTVHSCTALQQSTLLSATVDLRFCVHVLASGQVQGMRICGSCLSRYVHEELPQSVKHSDNAVRQNNNKQILRL
jgi:hypothetical protein